MISTHTLVVACLTAVATASDNILSDKILLGSSDLPSDDNAALPPPSGSVPLDLNVTVLEGSNPDGVHLAQQQQKLNFIGYLLLSSFLLVLSVVLILLLWNILRARQLFENERSPRTSRSMKLRIQRRYETIEHWIITKTVQPHDSFSDTVVDNFGHHEKNQTLVGEGANPPTLPSESDGDENPANPPEESCACRPRASRLLAANDDDDDPPECPICMSTLKAGQIVSWSANEKCNHTYHHQCIKEWLLRHVDCCLCKEVFLPVDEKKGKAKQAALQELSCRYAASSATSFFCEKRGLVRIPRSVRCTRAELTELEQRIFDGTVPPTKLVDLRGGRDCTTSCNDDDFPPLEGRLIHNSTAETLSDNGEDEDEDHGIIGTSLENAAPRSPAGATMPTITTESLPFSPVRITNSVDVELGGELLSASYHLEKKKSALGDNRCCVLDNDDSVEVHETSSSEHIAEEEEEEFAADQEPFDNRPTATT